MEEQTKSIARQLDAILRHFLPGCIFIGTLAINGNIEKIRPEAIEGSYFWIFLSLSVGTIIYAMHYAFFEYIFTIFSICAAKKWYANHFNERTLSMKPRTIRRWLTNERWARSASEDKIVLTYHSNMQKESTWLVFTYCSGYAIILSSLAPIITSESSYFDALSGSFGIMTLLFSIRADVDLTRKEIWLNEKFPQLSFPPENS